MSGISSLGSAANAYLQQSPFATGISGVPTSSGGAAGGQASATISGQGQLLSQLQLLQTQNPTKFKQVASQIANQLQTAAQQQASSSQSSFLNHLASEFKNVANGGNLSQLQPSHHAHHGHGTYNSSGQAVPSSSSTSSAHGSSMQSLFQSMSGEVAQALGGK